MSVLAVVATAFGAVVLFIGFVFWLISRKMTSHLDRTVPGQVVDYTADDVSFNAEQGWVQKRNRAVRVHVSAGLGYTRMVHKVYTYTVGTRSYTRADRVSYSENLARAAIGREVTVSYDSSDPGCSALVAGYGFTLVYRILFSIGGALLLLAAWLWLRALV